MQPIKVEYVNLQGMNEILVADLIPLVRAIYKPLITVYDFGNTNIP